MRFPISAHHLRPVFALAIWAALFIPSMTAQAQRTLQQWGFADAPADKSNIPPDRNGLNHPPRRPPKMDAKNNGYVPIQFGSTGLLLLNHVAPELEIANYPNNEKRKKVFVEMKYRHLNNPKKELGIFALGVEDNLPGNWTELGGSSRTLEDGWKIFRTEFSRNLCPSVEELTLSGTHGMLVDYVKVDTQCIGRNERFQTPFLVVDCNGDGHIDVQDANCVSPEDLPAFFLSSNLLPGDIDGDQEVGFGDFLILSGNFGAAGQYTDGDINRDGDVAFADFLILSSHFGQSSGPDHGVLTVPEPVGPTIFLTGLVGLACCRKQRIRSI